MDLRGGAQPVFPAAVTGIAFYPDHGEDMERLIQGAANSGRYRT